MTLWYREKICLKIILTTNLFATNVIPKLDARTENQHLQFLVTKLLHKFEQENNFLTNLINLLEYFLCTTSGVTQFQCENEKFNFNILTEKPFINVIEFRVYNKLGDFIEHENCFNGFVNLGKL